MGNPSRENSRKRPAGSTIQRKRKKKPRWLAANTVLGATVILLCAFIYLYEHDSANNEDMVQTNAEAQDAGLAESLHSFTFRTSYEIFSDQVQNVIYSPVSLYYTLLTAACGTAGETADQLNSWLGINKSYNAAKQADRLYQQLYLDGELGKLKLSSSIWNDRDIKLKRNFKKTVKENCHASVHAIDFGNGDLPEELNEWVQKQTSGAVVPQRKSAPASGEVLYMLNTIYFYDEWREQFNRSATKTDRFFLADGTITEAEFMVKEFSVHGFSRGNGFTRSFLSLKESGTMYFVLPDEGVPLTSFFESENRLKEVLEGGEDTPGQVYFQIPKFSIDTTLDGKSMLERAGLHSIFAEDSDFSNMSENDIFISSLEQDSHISINEDGVEAAAFTEAALMEAAAMEEGKADMILDRPFLFGIRYGDIWLFIGICSNPAE